MSSIDFSAMCEEAAERLYLEHHGIKGQKWGQRRWQNEDGSLTPAGYEHYGYGSERGKKLAKKLVDTAKKYDKAFASDKSLNLKVADAAEHKNKMQSSFQVQAAAATCKSKLPAYYDAIHDENAFIESIATNKKITDSLESQYADMRTKEWAKAEGVTNKREIAEQRRYLRSDVSFGDDYQMPYMLDIYAKSNLPGAKEYKKIHAEVEARHQEVTKAAKDCIDKLIGENGNVTLDNYSKVAGKSETLSSRLVSLAESEACHLYWREYNRLKRK